jgi:hypothetical protein
VRVKAVVPLLAGIRWCGELGWERPLRATADLQCAMQSVAVVASSIDLIDEAAVVIRVMKMSFR